MVLHPCTSHEGGGRNTEALAESPHLANIEFALARQDFRDHTLAANLVQIALVDAVLRHQKLQRLHAGDAWQRVVLGLMVFVASGLIEQGFEYRHHPLVVRFVPDGGNIGGVAKGLPRREQVLECL